MKELNCKWRWCSLLGSQESTTYSLHGGKRLVGTWKVVLELLLQNESFKHGFSYGTTYCMYQVHTNLHKKPQTSDGSGNFSSRFPGRDETGIAVLSRLVSEFWKGPKSRLVPNLNFWEPKSLVLSRHVSFCLAMSWKHFLSRLSVSSCLVSAIFCPDPSAKNIRL